LKEEIKAFKKEFVLQKASALFEQRGYEKTKMSDIAKACNVSIGTLYKIYNSKDEIFYDYVHYQIDSFYNYLEEAFSKIDDPKKRLLFFLEAKYALFESKRALLKDTIAADPLFFAKLSANKQNPAFKIYRLVAQEFKRLGTPHPLKASYLLNALTYGYVELWLLYGGDLRSKAKETLELFFKGINDV